MGNQLVHKGEVKGARRFAEPHNRRHSHNHPGNTLVAVALTYVSKGRVLGGGCGPCLGPSSASRGAQE